MVKEYSIDFSYFNKLMGKIQRLLNALKNPKGYNFWSTSILCSILEMIFAIIEAHSLVKTDFNGYHLIHEDLENRIKKNVKKHFNNLVKRGEQTNEKESNYITRWI